jgi:protein-disulfide isomerase
MAASTGLTEAQRAEVVEILRRALREDPSILREAITAMQQAEEDARANAQRNAIRANANALFRDPADPVLGNPQGSITLVEFFDARCGFCKSFHPTLEEAMRRNRELRVVMKDMPILGPPSVQAARALLAAQRQNRYAQLLGNLLRLREEVTDASLRRESDRAGLDWTRLRRDMEDAAILRRIEANLALARSLDIQGTPAIIVGEQLLPGAVDLRELEAAIAAA